MDTNLIKLNADKALEENLDKYKEIFIDYYGEDKRDYIEEIFNNTTLIGYITPNKLSSTLSSLRKKKSQELINSITKLNKTPFTKEELFGTNIDLEYSNIIPIERYIKFKNLYNKTKEERIKDYLEKHIIKDINEYVKDITIDELIYMNKNQVILDKYKDISPWIQSYILKDYSYFVEEDLRDAFNDSLRFLKKGETIDSYREDNYKELNEISTYYKEAKEMYKDYLETLKPYIEEEKENEQVRIKETIKKDEKILVKAIKFMNEEDLKELKNYINNKEYVLFPITAKTTFTSNRTILDSFSTKSNNKLNNPNTPSNIKEIIIEDRIKYFNYQGINLGDNYNDYINNEQVKRIIPDTIEVDNFIKEKKKIDSYYKNTYYKELPLYKKIIEKIGNNRLLSNKDINESLFTSFGANFVIPNIVEDGTGYKLAPVVLICFNEEGLLDHNIVHELNHVYELHLESVKEKDVKFMCGWDEIDEKKDEGVNNKTRDYELFNEIINEKIAQEIESKAHNKGKYILDNKSYSQITGTTMYEYTDFLVNDFFNKYKKEIIESRTNGNINIIKEKVGEENFEELNDLFRIYRTKIKGNKVYNLLQELERGEDTTETRVYHDLESKRNTILESMNNSYNKDNSIEK